MMRARGSAKERWWEGRGGDGDKAARSAAAAETARRRSANTAPLSATDQRARTLYRSSPAAAAATDTRRHAPHWLSTSGTRAFLVFVLEFAISEAFVVLYVFLLLCMYIF